MGAKRIVVLGMVLALLGGALWVGPAPVGAQEISLLPSLTAEQLLEMAAVDAPPEGISLRIHADFPEDAPLLIDGLTVYSLTASTTPEGGVLVHNAVTSSGDESGNTVDECSDPAFIPNGVVWNETDIPVKWWFRRGSTPKDMSSYRTTRAIRVAHRVWPRQITDCPDAEVNRFHFDYQGWSPRHIGYDNYNVVDFGSLNGPLAVAYTWYIGGRIVEVDLRLNKFQYKWTNVPGGSGKFQVVNVATHEIGHHLGLDDLSAPHSTLTMYGIIGKGEMRKTTLGRGDMKGARAVSP